MKLRDQEVMISIVLGFGANLNVRLKNKGGDTK